MTIVLVKLIVPCQHKHIALCPGHPVSDPLTQKPRQLNHHRVHQQQRRTTAIMAAAGVRIVIGIIVAMAIVVIIDDDNDIETPGCFQTLVPHPYPGQSQETPPSTASADPFVFDTNFTGSGVDSVSGNFTTTNMGTVTFNSTFTSFTSSETFIGVHGRLMADSNLQLLVDCAKLLKPILGKLVFVGDCTTALLITDKGLRKCGQLMTLTRSQR